MKLIRKLFGCIVFAIMIYSGFMVISTILKYDIEAKNYSLIQKSFDVINTTSSNSLKNDSIAENMKTINPD
uniref:hypothetical protein n=1 Tax=Serratia marcescens TaxID=615 RepID=UPI0011E89CB5